LGELNLAFLLKYARVHALPLKQILCAIQIFNSHFKWVATTTQVHFIRILYILSDLNLILS